MKQEDISIYLDEDLQWNIREEYKGYIADGKSSEEATNLLINDYEELLQDRYVSDIFWITLAETQWKYGRLLADAKNRAIEAIDSGRDLERFGSDKKIIIKRKKYLQEIKSKLLSAQPAPKGIRKQFQSISEFETGDVISFKTESDKYVLMRVIGLLGTTDNNSPIVEFLDWYKQTLPTEEEIQTLKIREEIFPLPNKKYNKFNLVHVKAKDYPREKVSLIFRSSKPYHDTTLPCVMVFWNQLDEILKEKLGFGINIDDHIVDEQKAICKRYKAKFTPTDMESLLGLSSNTDGINIPINGLRHPQEGDTSGWYIWSGKEFTQDKDFFKPMHAKHLKDISPMIMKFLGLPPGYRFLYTGDYLDIWYDPDLLNI